MYEGKSMRQFTVTTEADGKVSKKTYQGFDANREGADFELVPEGRVSSIEGSLYCDSRDLVQAIVSAILYNHDVFGRTVGCTVLDMDGNLVKGF